MLSKYSPPTSKTGSGGNSKYWFDASKPDRMLQIIICHACRHTLLTYSDTLFTVHAAV